MALARSRRGDSGTMNYWPGFVDALSTLILSIIFILTVFVVVQFYLQQEVQGKDTALDRLKHQIAQLTDLLSMEKTSKARPAGPARNLARLARHRAEREREIQKPLSGRRPGRVRRQGQDRRAERPALQAEEHHCQRAGPGRGTQPADRRAAPAVGGSAERARPVGIEEQGGAGPHHRARPAAQPGARREGARAERLSLRVLRQAAPDPRRPARLPHCRRPFRAAVGGVLRHQQRHAEDRKARPSSTRWPVRW